MNSNDQKLDSEEILQDKNIAKKTSSYEFSPTLLTNFSNKSGIKLSNSNNDMSIGDDFIFLKNDLTIPNRKETNYSIGSNATKPAHRNVSLGKIQDGLAVLLGDDMNLLELPFELLPKGSKKGNIFKISIERNFMDEEIRKESILNIQKEILENESFF